MSDPKLTIISTPEISTSTIIQEYNEPSNITTPSRTRTDSNAKLVTTAGFSSGISNITHKDETGKTHNAFQNTAYGLNTAVPINFNSNAVESGISNASRLTSKSIDQNIIDNGHINNDVSNESTTGTTLNGNISSKVISLSSNIHHHSSTSNVSSSTTSVTKNGATVKSASVNAAASSLNSNSSVNLLSKQFKVITPAKINTKLNTARESRSTSTNSNTSINQPVFHELNDANTSFTLINKNVRSSPIVSNVPSKYTSLPNKSTPSSATRDQNTSDLSVQINDLKNSFNTASISTPNRSTSRNSGKLIEDVSNDKSDNLHPKYPSLKTLGNIPTGYATPLNKKSGTSRVASPIEVANEIERDFSYSKGDESTQVGSELSNKERDEALKNADSLTEELNHIKIQYQERNALLEHQKRENLHLIELLSNSQAKTSKDTDTRVESVSLADLSKFSNEITESVSMKLLSQLIPRIKSLEDTVVEQSKLISNKTQPEFINKSDIADILHSEVNSLNLFKNVEAIIEKKFTENSSIIHSEITNNVTSSLRSYISTELHDKDIKHAEYDTPAINDEIYLTMQSLSDRLDCNTSNIKEVVTSIDGTNNAIFSYNSSIVYKLDDLKVALNSSNTDKVVELLKDFELELQKMNSKEDITALKADVAELKNLVTRYYGYLDSELRDNESSILGAIEKLDSGLNNTVLPKLDSGFEIIMSKLESNSQNLLDLDSKFVPINQELINANIKLSTSEKEFKQLIVLLESQKEELSNFNSSSSSSFIALANTFDLSQLKIQLKSLDDLLKSNQNVLVSVNETVGEIHLDTKYIKSSDLIKLQLQTLVSELNSTIKITSEKSNNYLSEQFSSKLQNISDDLGNSFRTAADLNKIEIIDKTCERFTESVKEFKSTLSSEISNQIKVLNKDIPKIISKLITDNISSKAEISAVLPASTVDAEIINSIKSELLLISSISSASDAKLEDFLTKLSKNIELSNSFPNLLDNSTKNSRLQLESIENNLKTLLGDISTTTYSNHSDISNSVKILATMTAKTIEKINNFSDNSDEYFKKSNNQLLDINETFNKNIKEEFEVRKNQLLSFIADHDLKQTTRLNAYNNKVDEILKSVRDEMNSVVNNIVSSQLESNLKTFEYEFQNYISKKFFDFNMSNEFSSLAESLDSLRDKLNSNNYTIEEYLKAFQDSLASFGKSNSISISKESTTISQTLCDKLINELHSALVCTSATIVNDVKFNVLKELDEKLVYNSKSLSSTIISSFEQSQSNVNKIISSISISPSIDNAILVKDICSGFSSVLTSTINSSMSQVLKEFETNLPNKLEQLVMKSSNIILKEIKQESNSNGQKLSKSLSEEMSAISQNTTRTVIDTLSEIVRDGNASNNAILSEKLSITLKPNSNPLPVQLYFDNEAVEKFLSALNEMNLYDHFFFNLYIISLIEPLFNIPDQQQVNKLKECLLSIVDVFNSLRVTDGSPLSKLTIEYNTIISHLTQYPDPKVLHLDLSYLRGNMDLLPSLITTNVNPCKGIKLPKGGKSSIATPNEDSDEPKIIIQTVKEKNNSFSSTFAYFMYNSLLFMF